MEHSYQELHSTLETHLPATGVWNFHYRNYLIVGKAFQPTPFMLLYRADCRSQLKSMQGIGATDRLTISHFQYICTNFLVRSCSYRVLTPLENASHLVIPLENTLHLVHRPA